MNKNTLVRDPNGNIKEYAGECCVCGLSPMSFYWTDVWGVAYCTRCLAPYQLLYMGTNKTHEVSQPHLELTDLQRHVAVMFWLERHLPVWPENFSITLETAKRWTFEQVGAWNTFVNKWTEEHKRDE